MCIFCIDFLLPINSGLPVKLETISYHRLKEKCLTSQIWSTSGRLTEGRNFGLYRDNKLAAGLEKCWRLASVNRWNLTQLECTVKRCFQKLLMLLSLKGSAAVFIPVMWSSSRCIYLVYCLSLLWCEKCAIDMSFMATFPLWSWSLAACFFHETCRARQGWSCCMSAFSCLLL